MSRRARPGRRLEAAAVKQFTPDQVEDLKAWTYAHNDGRVLIRFGKGQYRMHFPTCEHVFYIDKSSKVAAQDRYCFETETEANRWAWKAERAHPVKCEGDCRERWS